MENPLYLSATPSTFWTELETLDSALHTTATSQSKVWYLPTKRYERWAHVAENPPDHAGKSVNWYRGTAWQGCRPLGRAAFFGKLYLVDSSTTFTPEGEVELDEISVKYSVSTLGHHRLLTVTHHSHLSMYVPDYRLDWTRRKLDLANVALAPEANPTPSDCELVLGELRIGAAGAHRIILPENEG